MPIPKAVARFNRYVTNPIVRRVAGWAPGFGIVHHVGRRSGRGYSTPVNVFAVDDGFVFALTYGADSDWVRNVLAQGGCTIRHNRRDIRLTNPRLLPPDLGTSSIPAPVRAVLNLLNVTEFLRLDRSDSDSTGPSE